MQRTIPVQVDVLAQKRARANQFRLDRLAEGTLVVQLLSSPGSGKTTLLEQTAKRLAGSARVGVLVGDIATERDAARLRPFAPAVQITTGGACHLEIALVESAWGNLKTTTPASVGEKAGPLDFLFIEDVGNLVCPASHDVGQHLRVVLLSVTEGDDKAAKYPKAFRTSQALVITKSDLLPYVPFSVKNAIADARRIQSPLDTFLLSALSGDGLDAWIDYLVHQRAAMLLSRSPICAAT